MQKKIDLSLPIISSFIFSRFSSANGFKRMIVLLAWSFDGSNSKILVMSENNKNMTSGEQKEKGSQP